MKNVRIRYWYVAACIVFFSVAGNLFAGTAPTLEIISPKNGEDIKFGSAVVIAISIYDEENDVDTTSMKLEVNDADVTRQANTSIFLVTYQMTDTSKPGRQYISFSVSDMEGNGSTHESYFNVLAEPKVDRKVTLNGTVGAGGEYDKEASQSAIGKVELDLYGSLSPFLDYSLVVDATNEEASDKQRVSEFRLDLYSPVGALVLGDTTPSFSDYTIDGKQVFGVHLLPQFGWFGMEFIWGQAERGVDADDAGTEVETFKQMLIGGRLKFGRPDSFLWGISFLKVKDDKDSIYIDYDIDPDAPTPKDNIVLGTDFNFSFMNGRVNLYAEGNESLLNDDITGGVSDVDIGGWDLSKLDWLIIYNEHMVPFVPGLTSLAAKGALTIGPFAGNTFYGEYSYVGSSYFSLANESIVNDRQGFLLRDSVWLLNQKLFVNASYQRHTDNLQDTKDYKTVNSGTSAAVYVYPNPFLSINAGVDVAIAQNDAPAADVEAVDNLNITVTTGAAQDFEILASATNVYLTFTTALLRDNNDSSNDTDLYAIRLGAISYFNNFPLDTKVVLGGDISDPENSVYVEGYTGYRFLREETLYTYLGASYETGAEQLNLRTGLDYDITSDVALTAELQYLTSATDVDDLFISAFTTYEF